MVSLKDIAAGEQAPLSPVEAQMRIAAHQAAGWTLPPSRKSNPSIRPICNISSRSYKKKVFPMAKWRRLLLPAALLAVVIALGLWYTRARSLDAIVGNAEVVSLSALYNEATLTITDGGSVADISVWQTGDGLTPDDPVGAALTAALEERRYRATLLNLAGPRDRLGQETSGTVQLSLALDNGEFLSLTFGSGGQLTVGRADGLYAYTADRGQYDTLAAIIRIHGQPVPADRSQRP